MTTSNTKLPRTIADPWHDLPPVTTTRWVISRKQALLDAVFDETKADITAQAVQDRYNISKEEWNDWVSRSNEYGASALRVTQTQNYR